MLGWQFLCQSSKYIQMSFRSTWSILLPSRLCLKPHAVQIPLLSDTVCIGRKPIRSGWNVRIRTRRLVSERKEGLIRWVSERTIDFPITHTIVFQSLQRITHTLSYINFVETYPNANLTNITQTIKHPNIHVIFVLGICFCFLMGSKTLQCDCVNRFMSPSCTQVESAEVIKLNEFSAMSV